MDEKIIAIPTIMLIAVFLPEMLVAECRAGSIWNRSRKRSSHLFQDNIASQKGDTLTVLIEEESSFSHEGNRDMQTSSSTGASAGLQTSEEAIGDFTGELSQSSDREFTGSDSHSGSRQFIDSITVTVIDVLPNGNMVLAGKTDRNVAGEEVRTTLTGIARASDISRENNIPSASVANLQIHYETRESAFMKKGWLNALLNLLWPF